MTTNYLHLSELTKNSRIASLFDNLNVDALEVRDDEGNQIGLLYLEDFCNKQVPTVIPAPTNYTNFQHKFEKELLSQILDLSDTDIKYITTFITKKLGRSFVCCCNKNDIATQILMRIFNHKEFNIRYTESIFDLYDGDNVLFLSFNKIKLYRKAHKGRINSLLALNNVVLDCKNRAIFYTKYKDLLDTLSSIGIGCFYGIIPEAECLSCISESARRRVAGYGRADYTFCADMLGGEKSSDFIACLDQNERCHVIDNGIYKSLQDCSGKFYNVTGGMRMTIGQPTKFSHTAYVFGPCTTRGAMVSDENTIASFLQERFNQAGGDWIVLNCGVGGGSDLENSYRYVLSLPLKPGDIVFFIESGNFINDETIDGKTIFRLSDELNNQSPIGEWFLDRPAHCNADANRIIADAFFRRAVAHIHATGKSADITALNRFKSSKKIFSDSNELKLYISEISRSKFNMTNSETAGAILMHCNPMTRGHKYLISEALKLVDYLYVFLLSIDRSDFPYKLRKEMLLQDTQEFMNIRILDCGEFLGSPKVFPAYFTKDSMKHSRIDATKEVMVFCQHIAPALGITKRFVGTENRDFVTRQYNNQLKLILPMYGIDLIEIKRLTEKGRDVSAFLTRELIHQKQWDEVRHQVLPHTFKLLRKFCEENKNA